uniref:Uncharacterized protein n=1 Tax=Romanomermis culicivorax TaxID=13658 RepID=A0A915I4I9_ROMCU
MVAKSTQLVTFVATDELTLGKKRIIFCALDDEPLPKIFMLYMNVDQDLELSPFCKQDIPITDRTNRDMWIECQYYHHI